MPIVGQIRVDVQQNIHCRFKHLYISGMHLCSASILHERFSLKSSLHQQHGYDVFFKIKRTWVFFEHWTEPEAWLSLMLLACILERKKINCVTNWQSHTLNVICFFLC